MTRNKEVVTKDIDAILNSTMDELSDNTGKTIEVGAAEIKHLGVSIDYNCNINDALTKAKASKSYEVYKITGNKKQLVTERSVSTIPGNRPCIKR